MTEPVQTRIVIVDDHPMVAEGIQSILESYDDIEVMGTLTNGRQAIDQIDMLDPDVVLMNDLGLVWPSLPIKDQWHERARISPLPPTASKFSFNVHEASPDTLTQWGGHGCSPDG